ncbi:hypothetical protein DFH11DRAFT_1582492 [Phellopilus nigrolimitatus]|nr:hypothetical protein DFH11DRAFT_1582492 [Phellopilus nigrolimitatus]
MYKFGALASCFTAHLTFGCSSSNSTTNTNDYQRKLRTMPVSQDHTASLTAVPGGGGEVGSMRFEVDGNGMLVQTITGPADKGTHLNFFYNVPGISAPATIEHHDHGTRTTAAASLNDVEDENMDEDEPRARTPTQRMFSAPTLATPPAENVPLPAWAYEGPSPGHFQRHMPTSPTRRTRRLVPNVPTEIVGSDARGNSSQLFAPGHHDQQVPHPRQIQTGAHVEIKREESTGSMTNLLGLTMEGAYSSRPQLAQPLTRDDESEGPNTQAWVQEQAQMIAQYEYLSAQEQAFEHVSQSSDTGSGLPDSRSVQFRVETAPLGALSRSASLKDNSGPSRISAQLATPKRTRGRANLAQSSAVPSTPRGQVRPSPEGMMTRARAKEAVKAAVKTRSGRRGTKGRRT